MTPSRTQQAIQWLHAAPGRTQQQAAHHYGITQAAISAALGTGRNSRVQTEREACAELASAHGAHNVAMAIMKRGDKNE